MFLGILCGLKWAISWTSSEQRIVHTCRFICSCLFKMSREANLAAPIQQSPLNSETQQENGVHTVITEDSNNNTSLVDREQVADGSAAESGPSQNSPAVREIYKNSWLKRMPCADRWTGRFPKAQKPEKFWVVFCVHDDKDAYLEFYENRRSAYSHMPLNNVSLSKCLHISPTIVAQENDHEFVITLETQVIRLAASTNEQMLEWMDTLRTKLRDLRVLEPKDNLYSKEPIVGSRPSSVIESSSSTEIAPREDFSRLSLRDPNSPLPPVPGNSVSPSEETVPPSAIVYVRNPPAFRSSTQSLSTPQPDSPVEQTSPPENIFSFDEVPNSDQVMFRVSRSNSLVSQTSSNVEQQISSVPNTPSLYEPLFYSGHPNIRLGIRNPNYENPPAPRHPPPRMSSSVDIHIAHSTVRTHGLSNLSSTSDPSLNIIQPQTASQPTPVPLVRTQSGRTDQLPSDEGPPPYNAMGPRNLQQPNSSVGNGAIQVDENGKPLSLREVQVQKLQAEILHKSGVRLVLRKKDCINAIALVECFNAVWVAGWKQKEHPLLHNTFHVGDRIVSIAGHRIHTGHDAHKAIKHQPTIVEFIVRRTPCARVLAIKREYEGQDLGIEREGGTAEIKEVKAGGLAMRYGLTTKAPTLDGISLCNWVLTEINHRPLNMFFKDNEVHDRLNAVGLDISILVQPLDLVKALKKQLKAVRSYKDYIVQ